MKITGRVEVDAVTDVRCDVCGCSTRLGSGNLEYGILNAHWGYVAMHDGERYEVHLCETCFLATVADLKQELRTAHMFETDLKCRGDDFWLVARDDFFHDSR